MELLTSKGSKTELLLGYRCEQFLLCYKSLNFIDFTFLLYIGLNFVVLRKPAVIMIVGVNGGGKTTSLGKKKT